MKIYLSGKISGDPNWEAKFNKWEKYFIELGYEVVSPTYTAKILQERHKKLNYSEPVWQDYVLLGLHFLNNFDKEDAIFMIPDWQESDGAKIEKIFAGHIGIKIMYAEDFGIEDVK